MVDFLKQNPYLTKDDYLWVWSVPQIRLASYDFTHTIYLDKNKAKAVTYDNIDDFRKSVKMPIIGE